MALSWIWDWYPALSKDAQDLVKVSVAPSVAILLFVLTNAVQIVLAELTKRRAVRNMAIGIYREIAENVAYALRAKGSIAEVMVGIKARLRDDQDAATAERRPPSYRPLLAITESLIFYQGVASSIPSLRRTSLLAVTAYYRKLSDQRIAVDSIQGEAFLSITIESRCELIDELLVAFNEAIETGRAALAALEQNYPTRWFAGIRA